MLLQSNNKDDCEKTLWQERFWRAQVCDRSKTCKNLSQTKSIRSCPKRQFSLNNQNHDPLSILVTFCARTLRFGFKDECWQRVLGHLEATELTGIAVTCHRMNRLSDHPALWQALLRTDFCACRLKFCWWSCESRCKGRFKEVSFW